MRYLKTTIVLATLVLLSSCSNKTSGDAMAASKKAEMETKMLSNGYKKGTIVASRTEGDCPYVIQLEDDTGKPYFLDPINLDESYKKDGEKIWFTFSGLRMMNRCEKANPINLNAIEKRGE